MKVDLSKLPIINGHSDILGCMPGHAMTSEQALTASITATELVSKGWTCKPSGCHMNNLSGKTEVSMILTFRRGDQSFEFNIPIKTA
jgi:hypothetical protein